MEKREAWTGTHSCDTQERTGQRKGTERIPTGGRIVRRPFRKLRPCLFEKREPVDEREGIRRQEKQQTLQIVARNAMSVLVLQRHFKLLGRKRAEHAIRDYQPRTEYSRQRQERSILFHDQGCGGVSHEICLPARLLPNAVAPERKNDGPADSHERE